MKIGEKIKKLRIEKSMTQSELAGNFITRNMLSLIESGSAQPSLPTVIYLAERLNVPPGILVSDDNDEYFYRRMSRMENIRRAFAAKDYRICLDLCRSLRDDEADDSELDLICAECLLGVAKEEFFRGNLKASVALFDEACDCAAKTVYNTSHILAESCVYCTYMKGISPSLYADCADLEIPHGLAHSDDFCRYVGMLTMMDNGKRDDVALYVSEDRKKDVYTVHLHAKLEMIGKDHAEARHLLLDILNSDERVAFPVMYDVFRDLEICCRESGDFKGAYEYSGDKVVMLEKMLSEDSL